MLNNSKFVITEQVALGFLNESVVCNPEAEQNTLLQFPLY